MLAADHGHRDLCLGPQLRVSNPKVGPWEGGRGAHTDPRCSGRIRLDSFSTIRFPLAAGCIILTNPPGDPRPRLRRTLLLCDPVCSSAVPSAGALHRQHLSGTVRVLYPGAQKGTHISCTFSRKVLRGSNPPARRSPPSDRHATRLNLIDVPQRSNIIDHRRPMLSFPIGCDCGQVAAG